MWIRAAQLRVADLFFLGIIIFQFEPKIGVAHVLIVSICVFVARCHVPNVISGLIVVRLDQHFGCIIYRHIEQALQFPRIARIFHAHLTPIGLLRHKAPILHFRVLLFETIEICVKRYHKMHNFSEVERIRLLRGIGTTYRYAQYLLRPIRLHHRCSNRKPKSRRAMQYHARIPVCRYLPCWSKICCPWTTANWPLPIYCAFWCVSTKHIEEKEYQPAF